MSTASPALRMPGLVLHARTAADLMTTSPHSINANATIKEAAAFLTDKGFSAAPVIDDAGHPVGVISRTDFVVHDRERGALPTDARACDIMTPTVFCVTADTGVAKVIDELLSMKVRRVFVVDDGVLIGVISMVDVLRRLRPDDRN